MDAMKLMNKLLEGSNSVVDEPAMPEVILPKMERCPCCNSNSVMLIKDQSYVQAPFYVQCGELCHRNHVTASVTPAEAIARWNALPRALRWTHEPPKVAGKYWWRPSGKKIGRIRDMFVRNGEVGFLDRNDRFIKDTGDGEWAGPIPAPIE